MAKSRIKDLYPDDIKNLCPEDQEAILDWNTNGYRLLTGEELIAKEKKREARRGK